MKMTQLEQVRLQLAYIHVKDALDEIALIKNKDYTLMNVQTSLYRLEDVLQQYIEPVKNKKGE